MDFEEHKPDLLSYRRNIEVQVKNDKEDVLEYVDENKIKKWISVMTMKLDQDIIIEKCIVNLKMKQEEHKKFTNNDVCLLGLILGQIDPSVIQKIEVLNKYKKVKKNKDLIGTKKIDYQCQANFHTK